MTQHTITNELKSLEFETSWLDDIVMTDTEAHDLHGIYPFVFSRNP